MTRTFALLLLAVAFAILAFLCLDTWNSRHAPLYKKLEEQWTLDVQKLESSHKLPAAWTQLKDIQIIGGTPETKAMLKLIHPPLKINPAGQFTMETLVVVWEESGKIGTLVQYNIEDLKTKNTVAEIGRTLILEDRNQ